MSESAEPEKNRSRMYQSIFDAAGEAIIVCSAQGIAIECNQATLELFACTQEQLIGSSPITWSPEFQPEGRRSDEMAAEVFARAKAGEVVRFEWENRRSDDMPLFVDVTVRFARVEGDEIFVVISRDITKRKQTEGDLLSTKRNLEATLEALPDLLFDAGLDGRIYDYRAHRSDLLAAPPDAFLGKLFSEVLPPDAAEMCLSAIMEASEQGWSTGGEYALQLPHGECWFELSAAPKLDTEGQAKRFILLARDITERKNAATVLKASEQRFRDLVNTTDGIVWEADATTFQFTFISDKAVSLLGFPAEDWMQPGFWVEHLHPDDLAWAPEFCASCTGRLEPHDFEYRFIARDGRTVWLHDIVTVVAENGAPRWLRGIMVDVTRQKEVDDELARHRDHLEELVRSRTAELTQARDDALAANSAKSTFLATMSHELRTPMNGVMGMIDLALRRATDPLQIDWLNKSKSSAIHLLEVISDILDISKIESERLTLDERNFSLAQVLEDTVQMQGEAAQAKGLRLSHEIAPGLPDQLRGDATRLKQILVNFVSNAIKFSEHGQIAMSVNAVEEGKRNLLLRIEVTDQGIGISPEVQAKLFNAFTQADGTISRKYGGTGLGLIISKRIALLMGGDAGVISTEGQGSTFWATVKLKKGTRVVAKNVDADAQIRQRYRGQRILVVDDDPINREVAVMQLLVADLVVDTAGDGAEAVSLARKNSYAAILMDMQMPKLNGVEAAQQIRQMPGYCHTPIIAMTANAFAEDEAQCIEAGMTDFLSKPYDPEQLFVILLHALSQRDI